MKGYGFQIEGATRGQELAASVKHAMDWFWSRFHEQPTAAFMHPEMVRRYVAVCGDWPGNWPKLVENDKMNRQMMVLERGEPGQMRLL